MPETVDQLQARADKFVADRHNKLNAKQQASLDKLNARIAKARAAEAAKSQGEASTGPTYIKDVGAAPLPNNNRGQTEGQFYDCPDGAHEKFQTDYGYTIEWAFNDQLTKLLRPTEDTPDAASRQATAIAWTKGEIPFETYQTVIGQNSKYLGCIVIVDIHDLGAGLGG